MITSSAHTHCKFCDGENTAEEMVRAAIALGFQALGFSSHAACHLYNIGVGPHNINEYSTELLRLKEKYKKDIAVYVGVEMDSFSIKIDYPFDYTIGSVHFINADDGKVYCIDRNRVELLQAKEIGFGGSEQRLVCAYFSAINEMLTSLKPTICGHFDLIRCYNGDNEVINTSSSIYINAAAEVLKKHCKNVIFEINTGGVARGRLKTPYPELSLLKALHSFGGKVMINSDTHSVQTINACYTEAIAIAKAAGFEKVCALGKNGIEEIEI